jgi:hypothetical protein
MSIAELTPDIPISKTKTALKEIAAALKALDDKRRYRASTSSAISEATGVLRRGRQPCLNGSCRPAISKARRSAAPPRWRTTSPGNILTTG